MLFTLIIFAIGKGKFDKGYLKYANIMYISIIACYIFTHVHKLLIGNKHSALWIDIIFLCSIMNWLQNTDK